TAALFLKVLLQLGVGNFVHLKAIAFIIYFDGETARVAGDPQAYLFRWVKAITVTCGVYEHFANGEEHPVLIVCRQATLLESGSDEILTFVDAFQGRIEQQPGLPGGCVHHYYLRL